MAKITLTDIANLSGNPGSAETNINANGAAIEAAIENTLSRDGTSPNAMSSDIDMNSNTITNLKAPVNGSDAARKIDIDLISASALPDQSGNDGRLLRSDGTEADWSDALYVDESGDIGIGTTSPESALHITRSVVETPLTRGIHLGTRSSGNYAAIKLAAPNSSSIDFLLGDGVGHEGRIQYLTATADLRFYTNKNTTASLILDRNQNVAITAALKSWRSSSTVLQIGGTASLQTTEAPGAGNWFITGQNYYDDGVSDKYMVSDEASRHQQINGTHIFEVAPSGIANDPISWTTALTIDNGGSVGIGTSSPSFKLHVVGPALIDHTGADVLNIRRSGGTDSNTVIRFQQATTSYYVGATANKGLAFRYDNADVGGNPDVLFDTGGNVGIGTSSPASALHVAKVDANGDTVLTVQSGGVNGDISGISFHNSADLNNVAGAILCLRNGGTDNDIIFSTTGNPLPIEKMRLTSEGHLGIGNSSLEIWAAAVKTLQIGSQSNLFTRATDTILSTNAYYDGAYKYQNAVADEASLYQQNNGLHYFLVAPSGTAGTAISWTTALVINNNGTISLPGTVGTISTASTGNNLNFSRPGSNYITATDALGDISFQSVSTTVGRFDANNVAGNTRFMIYDVDNATLERVTVGAADSGGTGYKVLRILN